MYIYNIYICIYQYIYDMYKQCTLKVYKEGTWWFFGVKWPLGIINTKKKEKKKKSKSTEKKWSVIFHSKKTSQKLITHPSETKTSSKRHYQGLIYNYI